jgi:hypothetical protein
MNRCIIARRRAGAGSVAGICAELGSNPVCLFPSVPRWSCAVLSGSCLAADEPSATGLKRLPPAPVKGQVDFLGFFFGDFAAKITLQSVERFLSLLAFGGEESFMAR